jgi:hypothetical protein
MDSARVRLVIELEPGDPVCGSAAREGEPQIPFEGMLGFLSLFEQLRATADLHAAETKDQCFGSAKPVQR